MTTVTQSHVEKTVARSLMLIGGKAVESADGRYIDIENPATRRVIAQVPRGGESDVDAAVRAAAAAFEGWKRVTPKDRGRMLLRIADLVEAETEALARTVALETGNAIRTQARPEIKGDGGRDPLLRRAGGRDQGRDGSARRTRLELHASRADRGRWRHRPVECTGRRWAR